MVTKLQRGKKTLYVCDECRFAYTERKWAEQCEQWCREHHTCNLQITQHGVPLDNR